MIMAGHDPLDVVGNPPHPREYWVMEVDDNGRVHKVGDPYIAGDIIFPADKAWAYARAITRDDKIDFSE